jgi:hypothetical protein
MKGKTFLILLVAAGVLGGLAFLRFTNDKQSGGTKMGEKLFDALPVNQVASVVIADADYTVTLTKGDKNWQVKERDGYPADFDELRDTVIKLSKLKIGRSFTASPETLERLSLLAPSAGKETGKGTKITLKDNTGKTLADLILGQARKSDSGADGGQYLKKTDGDTVFLVDNNFRFLKASPTQWLQKDILNIKSDSIAEVACFVGDNPKPVYTLTRPEKGKAPQMSDVPEGRVADSTKLDQVFDAMAPLSVDDVSAAEKGRAADDDKDGIDQTRLEYRLYDGRQISVFPESEGDEYHLRIMAKALPDAASDNTREDKASEKKPAPPADQPDKSQGTDDVKPPESSENKDKTADEKAAAPPQPTAAELNEALGPWLFSVKKWQFDSFVTQPEGLLEELKEEGEKPAS